MFKLLLGGKRLTLDLLFLLLPVYIFVLKAESISEEVFVLEGLFFLGTQALLSFDFCIRLLRGGSRAFVFFVLESLLHKLLPLTPRLPLLHRL